MLKYLAALLTPKGKVFITAPFRPSGWKPADGIAPWLKYSYLHVPAYITYFSNQWFRQRASAFGLSVIAWDETHEDGQAFELVISKDLNNRTKELHGTNDL
jgi:hypothetical protein